MTVVPFTDQVGRIVVPVHVISIVTLWATIKVFSLIPIGVKVSHSCTDLTIIFSRFCHTVSIATDIQWNLT